MSNTQLAFLPRSRVPTRKALQASIDALGFPLKLNPKLDFSKDVGFSPCVLDGEKGAGCGVSLGSTAELLSEDKALAMLRDDIGSRDACISMTWHSGMDDCAAALIVSCALAKDFDATVSYEAYPPEPLSGLLKGARQALSMWRKERKRGRTRVTHEVSEHFDANLRDRDGWSLNNYTVRLSPDGTKAMWIAAYARRTKKDSKTRVLSNRLAVYENTERVRGALAVHDLFPAEDYVKASVDNHGHATAFDNDASGVRWTWFPVGGVPVEGRLFDRVSACTYPVADARKTITDLSLHILKQVPRRGRDGIWTLTTSLERVSNMAQMYVFTDFITTLPPFRTREERDAYLSHLRKVRDSMRTVRRKPDFREALEYVELYVSEAEKVLDRPWRKPTTRPRSLPRVREYQRRLDQAWKAHVRSERPIVGIPSDR